MNVQDMLDRLEERGYDVEQAKVETQARPDIANAPVDISENYRTTAGRVRWTKGHPKIILARRLFMEPGDAWKIVHEVFLHELAHLFEKRDRHGYRWASRCEKFGIAVEQFHDYAALQGSAKKLVAECSDCGQKIIRKRRLPKKRSFHCLKCGGPIVKL